MRTNRALMAAAGAAWMLSQTLSLQAQTASSTEGGLRKLVVPLLGARYREGSRSRETGFDAGGLVSYLYGRIGHAVPSRVETLAQSGERVSLAALEPWDLVVWGQGQDAGIGVFLGAKDFVHASKQQGKVVIDQLDDPRWDGRRAMGRRLLGPETKRAAATRLPAQANALAEESGDDDEGAEEPDYQIGKGRLGRTGRAWVGMASYYGYADGMAGQRTSSGERLTKRSMTAAHRTLPFGTLLKVTNLSNGRTVVVRVNDRGPHRRGRLIDLSAAAARRLGFLGQGVARVRIEVLRNETRRSR